MAVSIASAEDTIVNDQERNLYLAISLIKDENEARDLLRDLLTVEEIRNAANRWCVVQGLLGGDVQEVVRKRCATSKGTVTRANREIIRDGTGICYVINERVKGLKGT